MYNMCMYIYICISNMFLEQKIELRNNPSSGLREGSQPDRSVEVQLNPRCRFSQSLTGMEPTCTGFDLVGIPIFHIYIYMIYVYDCQILMDHDEFPY